jgi:hypothetical protein
LKPNQEELSLALAWVKERDASPEWEKYVERIFADFHTKLKR